MIRTIKSALKAARCQEQGPLTAALWVAEALREDAIEAAYNAKMPPLLLANVSELPSLIGRAEYALKTPWYVFLREGAILDLLWQVNHEAARDWD